MEAEAHARRLSFNERLYLAEERRRPGFCIQLVLEGEGGLEVEALRAALRVAAQENPGTRLVLRGVLGFARWVAEGPLPPVRMLDGWAPGAALPEAVDRPLDPVLGPTVEVLWAPGPTPRLVYRCFHGVMDASGLLHFAAEVAAALRGDPLRGAPCTQNDTEFVTALAGPRVRPALEDAWPPLMGPPPGGSRQVGWRRIRAPGAPPALVAKVATALAREAGHTARVMIPVDLRSYRPEPRSTANRTCPVFLDVPAEQTWRAAQGALLRALVAKEPLRLDPLERVGPWIPLALLSLIYALWTAGHRRKMRFPFSALVTHVALKGLEPLGGGGFRCTGHFLLPPQSDFIPLCVSAVSSPAGTDLVLSAPADLLADPRLDGLSATLVRALA